MVVVFNGVNMALHKGGRGAPEREVRGTSGNSKIRNLAVGDIVYESYLWTVTLDNAERGCRGTYHGRTPA